jgi:polysaccharide pyruvyl transferase WcaK-like protein
MDTANIGDYALLQATRRLVPRLQLVPGNSSNVSVSLFGGGTSYPYSLRYGTYPRRRLNVGIGLGVEDPDFSGRYGPLTLLAMHWSRFKVLGVRGYRSQQILAKHGISSVVTGDTALALERPSVQMSSEGAVGVCLVGEAMHRFGDPVRTREIVMDYCRRLLAEGCQVNLVPFCRNDFDQALDMQRQLGERVRLLDFWAPAIAEDLDVFLAELARLQFMVGERLHAAILAAAMAVPFVAIPYKPKCLDFVGSIDPAFGLSLSYDHLTADNLWQRTREALVQGAEIQAGFADRVNALRRTLRDTAQEIEDLVLGSSRSATPVLAG